MKTSKKRLTQKGLLVGCCLALNLLPISPAIAQDALWRSYYTSAQKAYQQGNFGEAEDLLLTALNAATKTDESLSTYYYLAQVCVRRQHFADADRNFKIVLDGLGTKTWAVLRPPDGTPDWEQSPNNIRQTEDSTAFHSVLKRKPPQLLTIKLAKPITIVDVLADFGTLLQLSKRYPEAENAYRQALVLSDCRPDQATNYEVRLLQKLSVLYQLEGRTAEGEAVNQQLALARNESVPDFDQLVSDTIKSLDRFGGNRHSQAVRLNNLALFCATHGDYGKAQSLFNRAVSCLNEQPGKHGKDRALILNNYSDLLLAMGRVSEAANVNREALSAGYLPDEQASEILQKSPSY